MAIYIMKPWYGKSKYVEPDTWEATSWDNASQLLGKYVWTDGTNLYYDFGGESKIYNKSTNTWVNKTWDSNPPSRGDYVWTDGENMYWSYGSTYMLTGNGWIKKTWTGLDGYSIYKDSNIWTDGINTYCSIYDYKAYVDNAKHYILNKNTGSWSKITFSNSNASNQIAGAAQNVWTDGVTIYFSLNQNHYKFNIDTQEWGYKTWNQNPSSGTTISLQGKYVWTDGYSIFYSQDGIYKILDKSTSTWSTKVWNGLNQSGDDGRFYGEDVWTDGNNIYLSKDRSGTHYHYKLVQSA